MRCACALPLNCFLSCRAADRTHPRAPERRAGSCCRPRNCYSTMVRLLRRPLAYASLCSSHSRLNAVTYCSWYASTNWSWCGQGSTHREKAAAVHCHQHKGRGTTGHAQLRQLRMQQHSDNNPALQQRAGHAVALTSPISGGGSCGCCCCSWLPPVCVACCACAAWCAACLASSALASNSTGAPTTTLSGRANGIKPDEPDDAGQQRRRRPHERACTTRALAQGQRTIIRAVCALLHTTHACMSHWKMPHRRPARQAAPPAHPRTAARRWRLAAQSQRPP